MIEKLPEIQTHSCAKINEKLNEVIDAVNELQSAKDVMFNRIDRLNDAMCDMRITTKNTPQPIKLYVCPDGSVYDNEDVAKSHAAENMQDKFAEQRKWIGKLCKFWDIDNDNLYYGPLTKIHDTSPYCYECNHKMCYANCEPVSEDLIYKGGDNE